MRKRPYCHLLQARLIAGAILCLTSGLLFAWGFDNNNIGAAIKANDAGTWTPIHSPNRTYQKIDDVTCLSANDCWAVGRYTAQTDIEVAHTLIEHWDGSSWSIVPSPNATDNYGNVADNYLVHISCLSPANCWAAGWIDSPDAPALIEHWDGATWSLVTSPHVDNEYYYVRSIACSSESNCWLVGEADNYDTYISEPLFEHWDGANWSIGNAPPGNFFEDVACNSGTDCWAIGDSFAHWDGSTWTVTASAGTDTYMTAITCLSASQCWSIGWRSYDSGPDEPILEKWDGNSWSAAPAPSSRLNDIACASASQCWAVGYSFDDDGVLVPRVEHWNGATWSSVAPAPLQVSSSLFTVTCNSSTDCWTAGFEQASHSLIEHWNGNAWSVASSADAVGGGLYTYLDDVACTSVGDCWAVGNVLLHWDGNSWSLFAESKNPLHSISCISATDCWAVGEERITYAVWRTFAEHWDGNAWTVVSSANADETHQNSLRNVVCTSTSDCWALGNVSDDDEVLPSPAFVEHWDGTAWTIVSTPTPTPDSNYYLRGVTCVSSSNCWIVGGYGMRESSQTLIEHWDGSSWQIVSSPNQNPDYNLLESVACLSASDCWAVGDQFQHWNGTSWTVVAHPNSQGFSDVSCTSSSNCHAVAEDVIERWDGSAWTSENVSEVFYPWTFDFRDMHAAACPSESHCWVVGTVWLQHAANARTSITQLITPTLIGAASRKTHGSAVTFDAPMSLDGSGIEPRSTNGAYTIVLHFDRPVQSGNALVTGTGNVSSVNFNGSDMIVDLTGVANAQRLTLTATNVASAGSGVLSAASVTIGFLIGDTNGDGAVNSGDISQVKSQSGQAIGKPNFREDLNIDGDINSGDISLVKSRSGSALPSATSSDDAKAAPATALPISSNNTARHARNPHRRVRADADRTKNR
jgi:hypothetical protein